MIHQNYCNDLVGEDDHLELPYELNALLKNELAIRVVFQPNKA